MRPTAIQKPRDGWAVTPNVRDYERERRTFRWETARQWLDGLPGGRGLNIAHEAVDRHAAGASADKVALRWLSKTGERRDLTYGDLRAVTNRFANALRSLGIGGGDRVFALAGRIPELYIACLGTLKNRSVFSPLFSAFGPEPIASRMALGEGKLLVTTRAIYEKKVAALRPRLPALRHVVVIG